MTNTLGRKRKSADLFTSCVGEHAKKKTRCLLLKEASVTAAAFFSLVKVTIYNKQYAMRMH